MEHPLDSAESAVPLKTRPTSPMRRYARLAITVSTLWALAGTSCDDDPSDSTPDAEIDTAAGDLRADPPADDSPSAEPDGASDAADLATEGGAGDVAPDLPAGVFAMPDSCAPTAAPVLDAAACAALRPDRLLDSVAVQLHVRGERFLALLRDVDDTLSSLTGPPYSLTGIHTVWGCADEWWAAGEDGRIFRHAGAEPESLPLPQSRPVTAGHGCGDDVLVGGDGVWRRNEADDGWALWGESVVWHNPDPADRPIDEVIAITRNGPWTIALANYGDAYLFNPERGDTWWYHGRTDDLNSDVFIRADGRGFTLHWGYGLYLDANLHFLDEGHVDTPLANTMRVHRLSDAAYWLVGNDVVRRVDGASCTEHADLPRAGYSHIAVEGSALDGERLWLSALLYDPEGGPQTASLLTLDPDEGWCVFPTDE